MDIPKIFWAYYDLFRRKLISIDDFSKETNLSKETIDHFLEEISKNA